MDTLKVLANNVYDNAMSAIQTAEHSPVISHAAMLLNQKVFPLFSKTITSKILGLNELRINEHQFVLLLAVVVSLLVIMLTCCGILKENFLA